MTHGFSPEFMQRVAGSLLHFLWQGAAVALLANLCLRLSARRSAETRYAVAAGALCFMSVCPVLTFIYYAQTGAITQRILRLTGETISTRPIDGPVEATLWWTQAIVLVWFGGMAVSSLRLAAGWSLSRRLVRLARQAVPSQFVRMCDDVGNQVALRRRVKILLSEHLDTPAAIGWLRPVILLPVSALTGLDETQIRAILAHEIAHIRRHDFLINAFQRVVEAVLFYHPAVWWLSSRVRTERENCCDDLAIRVCGDRLIYAEALIALERSRSAEPVFALAATGGGLVQRVRRILGREVIRPDWQSALAAVLLITAWIIGGVWQSAALSAEPLLPPKPAAPPPISSAVAAFAAIVTAQPVVLPETQQPLPVQPPASGPGKIEGIVARAGTAEAVAGVQVTLAGGPADPKAVQELTRALGGRGIVFAPANIGSVDEVIQQALDAAATIGVAPNFPSMRDAINNFRAANAGRFSGSSDATGRFTIEDVIPGQYTVQAEREGFFQPPEPLTVRVAGNQVSQLAVPVSPASTISGKIRDASGRPQTNVDVVAYALIYNNGYPTLQPRITKQVNDKGEYRLFWLQPGEYYLAAAPRPGSGGATPATSREQFLRTFFPNVPDANSTVPVRIKPGDQLSGMDIEIQKVIAAKIAGKVITNIPPEETIESAARTNSPSGSATAIMLISRDMTRPDLPGGNTSTIGTIPVNSGVGQFEIGGLLPGTYDLYARIAESGANGGAGFAFGFTPIEVHGEDLNGLSITVQRTVPVNGIVTVDGAVPQNPLRISILPDGSATRLGVYQAVGQRPVMPAADGTFSVIAVPPGHYHVQIGQGLPRDVYVSDVLQSASVFDTGFDVGTEPPSPLRVILKSGAAAVEGTVKDGQGKALANATVVVIPPPDRRQNRALYRTATTDATGSFAIRSLAPGNYKVFAWQNVTNGAYYNPRFMEKYEDRGQPVNLDSRATLKSALVAIPPEP
jgi:beta-lactamase regulating signal transducer with metallopeptidase domain